MEHIFSNQMYLNPRPLEDRVDIVEVEISEIKANLNKLERLVYKSIESTERFKEEMVEFKKEMKEFKDEMSEFKSEMSDFKDEMSEFKDEMREFKDEMSGFKSEMSEFKDKVDKNISNMNKQWSELARKMGTIVEDLFSEPFKIVLEKRFQEQNIDMYGCNIKKKGYEFDILAECEDKIYIVEIKSNGNKSEYQREFLEKKDTFSEIFKDKQIILVFGSLSLNKDSIRYLTKNGIYALVYSGENCDIVNYEDLKS
ncbi:MAG: hypothetical protein HXX81_06955 [Campylobacterales bacterium]|nr:hypothetical protein [Campylobacterales bacterium]